MTWTSTRRPARLIAGLGRALVALTVLVALVVGLPYGLVHYIGWPLPDHISSWVELQNVLTAPMSAEFLLNLLACALWPLWARFTFDVLTTISDTIRTASWPRRHGSARRGPLHAAAGVLVGAILFSLLSSRASTPSLSMSVATSEAVSGRAMVATALYGPTAEETRGAHQAVVTTAVHTRAAGNDEPGTETVRLPEHGVYDSLWRVAQRCLGDGDRWPEIWKLNQGATQNDGRVLTTPSLIQPGWQLRLPTAATPPPPSPAEQRPPAQPDHTNPSTPVPALPSTPAPAAPPGAGITLSTGAFVGLGLAALITVAMVTARLHRRRRYQPGTAEPDDPGAAPVVRALRIAHDSATLPDDASGDLPLATTGPTDLATRDRARATAHDVLNGLKETALGMRDGHAVALDLAHERGLGLIGPGAYAAARALIVTQLAQAAESELRALVVIPVDDAQALFGADLPHRMPARLRVADNLSMALDTLEAELLTRVRMEEPEGDLRAPLILVATPTSDTERRLQAVLDNGSGLGLTGLLLGQWRPGGTARVRADGTIGATSPSLADSLANARLFTLPENDTTELLTLLQAAEPEHHEPEVPVEPGLPVVQAVVDIPSRRSEPPEPRTPEQVATPEQPSGVARVDEPEPTPLQLQILGRLHLTWLQPEPVDVIEVLAPRQREILVYLALHRGGSRREALTAALWPDAPGDRPYNSFHATLSQLRRSLRTVTSDAVANITSNDDGHYGLDQSLLTVDLWQLQDALAVRRHAATSADGSAALRHVVELYQGDLAESITADWIDGPREALRREVLDALSAQIRLGGHDNPEQTLVLLEQARGIDPYNEAIYRDLMRTQALLGQYDSVSRTLNLLTSRLAELGQRPTPDTAGLADFLRRPRDSRLRGRAAS